MHKIYPISAPKMALTAVLTTSILLACTPAEQQGQSQNQMKPLLLPERETAVIEEDAEVKTLSSNELQAVVQDQLRKQKAAKSNLMADSYAQRGRAIHAEKMISPMVGYAAQSLQSIRAPSEAVDRENYEHFDDNQVKLVAEAPVSTFSIDVDTGSYETGAI